MKQLRSPLSWVITNMQVISNNWTQSLRLTRWLLMHEQCQCHSNSKILSRKYVLLLNLPFIFCGSVWKLYLWLNLGQWRALTLRASNSRRAGWYCSWLISTAAFSNFANGFLGSASIADCSQASAFSSLNIFYECMFHVHISTHHVSSLAAVQHLSTRSAKTFSKWWQCFMEHI